jgi:hypothetical protein
MNRDPTTPPAETQAEIPSPESDPDQVALREDVPEHVSTGDADIDMMM